MSPTRVLGAACAFVFLAAATPAFAQATSVRVGGLSCSTGARVGMVLGSRQRMNCVFLGDRGERYYYQGKITRVGLDIGVTSGGRLFWGVFAPTSAVGKGALRGNYVGASGGASFGPGIGANVLIGGSNRTIQLQPLSIEGQVGLNLAVGVAGLQLR